MVPYFVVGHSERGSWTDALGAKILKLVPEESCLPDLASRFGSTERKNVAFFPVGEAQLEACGQIVRQLKPDLIQVSFLEQDVFGRTKLGKFPIKRQALIGQKILKIGLPEQKESLEDSRFSGAVKA